jgi:hypothetical protein
MTAMAPTSERSGGSGTAGLLFLAIALVAAGWLIGRGFSVVRTADRYVSVKGVAERSVKADLALWPIQLASSDDDLGRAQARIDENVRRVTRFLLQNGIDTTEVKLQGLRVTDAFANPYQPQGRPGARFVVKQTMMVRTSDPGRVQAASEKVGELVGAGVVLSSGEEWGPGGPTYLFKRLNDLKPAMIAEATAEARKAAGQFAKDSRSRLGGIRRASQGVFVILPRDEAPGIAEPNQMEKTVRVVTTVEYLLRD